MPSDCELTFVQVLSRHGARYPTAKKSKKYKKLVAEIQANATAFPGKYSFLRSYNYALGSDDLTTFGKHQMINSGTKFHRRYEALARDNAPFIRSSNSSRVVESGNLFLAGFEKARIVDQHADHQLPTPEISVIISEDHGFNNSLNHNSCPYFEDGKHGDSASKHYTTLLVSSIKRRLETDLPGVRLSDKQVTYLMDLCAFDTVSSTPDGSKLSPFCNLFDSSEWAQYDYLQSLSKYYTYGAGNPLGPSQGVGFVNELISRLNNTPVHDHTTTNRTLDAPDAGTFPLNRTIYADFTHDNGMIPVFFALGLYNDTEPLPITHVQSAKDSNGYSASWTVPFGARAYIEMMQCKSQPDPEPLVRVLVNDRVVPLHGCPVDSLGRCRRSDFIEGLSFARSGGNWTSCYA